MTFKPAIWRPIAVVLSGLNVVAVGFAAAAAEPLHAATHGALALAFGLWAQRMRSPPTGNEGELEARVEALELEVSSLRQDLAEAHERLDFAERLLSRVSETRRPDRES
jgi:hypothetical protein